MIAVVALSLLSSVLIVWLYVNRNLIARLTASERQHAGHRRRQSKSAACPSRDRQRRDRAAWAEALIIFRDTAVEVEEKQSARGRAWPD